MLCLRAFGAAPSPWGRLGWGFYVGWYAPLATLTELRLHSPGLRAWPATLGNAPTNNHKPITASISAPTKRIRISLSCLIVLANAIRQISDIRISISIGLGAIGQTRMLRPRLCIGAFRRGGDGGALLLYRHDKSTAGGEVHLELAVLGDGNLAALVVFCRTVGIDAVVERVGLATGDVER